VINIKGGISLIVLWAVVAATSGCAARQAGFAQKFVKPGEPTVELGTAVKPPAPGDDLQQYARKLRELQSKATPKTTLLPTIESRDPVLQAALLRVAALPTAANHRLVAAAYRRAGVHDYAFRHYQKALRVDSCDGAALQGIAQLWRDWGMPDLALGDAYRAVSCEPKSPAAYNTLGTVFQTLGQHANARLAYQRALALDGTAVFALNNLCFLSLQEGDGRSAEASCQRALALEPRMPAARTNLAVAYAMQGDVKRAEQQLLDSADPAHGQYNVGILRMSLGEYESAAEAFDTAAAARPSLWDAWRRAAQARQLAYTQREP
jgi:Flp pilus assembly protein TadD